MVHHFYLSVSFEDFSELYGDIYVGYRIYTPECPIQVINL